MAYISPVKAICNCPCNNQRNCASILSTSLIVVTSGEWRGKKSHGKDQYCIVNLVFTSGTLWIGTPMYCEGLRLPSRCYIPGHSRKESISAYYIVWTRSWHSSFKKCWRYSMNAAAFSGWTLEQVRHFLYNFPHSGATLEKKTVSNPI